MTYPILYDIHQYIKQIYDFFFFWETRPKAWEEIA